MARLDTSSDHNDVPVLLDLQTGQVTPMRMDGWNSSWDFRPHGISMYVPPDLRKEPSLTVGFVNHRRDWSVIELFDWHPGDTHLKWRDTIKNKFITTPNDLTMTSSEAFYVTNDHRHRFPGVWRTLEEYLQRPWSNVMYRNDRGKVTVATDGLAYANGIASKTLRDGTVEIWVAASLELCVKVYHQKQGGRVQSGSLRHMYDVELDFVPDNLDIDEDGAVYVAGHPKILNFIAERLNREGDWVHKIKAMFPAYSKVARIVNATGEQAFMGHPYKVEMVFADQGKTFRATSIAVANRKRGRMWLGALGSSGVGQCDLSSMKVVPYEHK
jgi:arylesterase/paraoxonase